MADEWHSLQELHKQVSRNYTVRENAEQRTIREILRNNLYGVDINPASVEITKLAMWLHTARGDQPLSGLDMHIRDGNSLIGTDFYDGLAPCSDEEQERINAFDWQTAFPGVFERGGFDVVIGNPPYVKLQNFRKAHPDMAGFLKATGSGGQIYESTQTGNFDLFLPFIEKGIDLLNENGRLGYIAPSAWTMNDYGRGLRDHIFAGRNLYGWIDFGSHQVFEEATTYTALQFFTKRPNEAVKVAFAPEGIISEDPWAGNDASLAYSRLTFGDRWLMVTGADRELIDGLYERCYRLGHPEVTRNIFVGIQTSADDIYHLKRLGPGRYLCAPKGTDAPPPYEVRIEDAVMKPLVSGAEAKRYVEPATETYLLFPYRIVDGRADLFPASHMAAHFPLAWSYLESWEEKLRSRESNAFDDDQWHRFGRNQNLNKQEIEKLVVPRLVTNVCCSVDHSGSVYLDNVDVGGVSASQGVSPYWLSGLLNAPTCGFTFRRIAKPFRGDFRSANKQFIAPLPIPDATQEQQNIIAACAERLQVLHTRRRDLLVQVERRLEVVHHRAKPVTWLFPNLTPKRELEIDAPARLEAEKKRAWAKVKYERDLQTRLDALGSSLRPGVAMGAAFEDGELTFSIDGVIAVQKIFLSDTEGPFIAAQWKLLASTYSVTAKTDGKKLANALCKVGQTDNAAVVVQITGLQQEIGETEASIAAEEAALNAETYVLYGLSDEEIRLVEGG